MRAGRSDLNGKKVLVVESEFLLPLNLYQEMEKAAAEIIGPVGFVDDVSMLVQDVRPDAAIVDRRLEFFEHEAVCRVLFGAGVPILKEFRPRSIAGRIFSTALTGRTTVRTALVLQA